MQNQTVFLRLDADALSFNASALPAETSMMGSAGAALANAMDMLRQHLPPAVTAKADLHLQQLSSAASPYLEVARSELNQRLGALEPVEIVVVYTAAMGLLYMVYVFLRWVLRPIAERGLAPVLFDAIRAIPPIRSLLDKEKSKMKDKIISGRKETGGDVQVCLPARSTPPAVVLQRIQQRAAHDMTVWERGDGSATISGGVYIKGQEHKEMLDSVYSTFSLVNALHASAYPSVRQMEAEVIAMTAALLGGGPGGSPDVCGSMTSGGTESILSAVMTSRNYMVAKKGIRHPEMVIANSAHAAFWKAAEYFRIKLHVVNTGRDYRASAAQFASKVNRNTVLVVASAASFPHGLVDHVESIAALARRRGVCCHVDSCLGGYCLPFVRKLGHPVPPFDFSVPGVTSMSVDTHKFGMGHKGTSVVLYASPDIRQHQYTRVTEWTGGLYISPGISGSRPGAAIATAWASLVAMGEEGFLRCTKEILSAGNHLADGIEREVPELKLVGRSEMGVVSFMSAHPKLNVYKLNDWLDARGWHLNALQHPAALHFCFTAASAGSAGTLLGLVREGVACMLAEAEAGGKGGDSGSAPLYGMANISPDRGMLAEFLVAYQDVMLTP